jgi:hypothetical protein
MPVRAAMQRRAAGTLGASIMTTVTRRSFTFALALCALTFTATAARASFHFMQIEQIIVGVDGDTSVQAIQLRMRSDFQNQVQFSRLVVWDAGGANPIELIHFPTSVPNGHLGDRVLVASANFANSTDPALTPDFILTNLIPDSYLAAGSLTFEDTFDDTVLWRLSWGGDAYTGPNDGRIDNDPDGDFGPPFPGPLPSAGMEALFFTGPAGALSTRNIDDYDLTAGAAEFTNNQGESGTISYLCDPCDMNCDGAVNAFDIEPFLDLLFGPDKPCGRCTGDVNGDGSIDAFDIEPFLECLFG